MLNCPHCAKDLTPHQIGVLHAAVARIENRTSRYYWGAKLTEQDATRIRKSTKTNWTLAEEYNVSFSTISRIKNNQTHKAPIELKCPHCGHKLTPKEMNRLFAMLGGSTMSSKRAKAIAASRRKRSKLSEEDVANIRKSNAPMKELARQYEVRRRTITQIRRNEIWKSIP